MKLAFFTDLQLDSKPPRDRLDVAGRSIRFQESEATISAAMDDALALGVDGWVFPGDATEHKNPPSAVLASLARLFSKWRGKRIWAIPGNHDGSVYEVSSSSIEPLAVAAGDGLNLYQTVSFDPALRCLFIPYLHRHTEADIRALVCAALKDAGNGKIFVVMHYGPKGATVGAANTVLQSDYLSADVFDGFNVDHVFCGHIHKFQKVQHGGIQFHVIGSTLICNMGEREDRKTWCMFDTVTRTVTDYEIKQPRRWLNIPWQQVTPSEPQWQAGDIVAITGEHPRDCVPKAIIAEAVRNGALPEPFHISYESKPERAERVSRANVSAQDGLREGLRKFAKDEYKRESMEPGQVAPAAALAMDVVAEAGGSPMFTELRPTRIRIRDFTTLASLDYMFDDGVPVLVIGENGIGKSNFQAAIYWAQTGEMPKGLGLADAVNRQKDSCSVEIEYVGSSPEHAEQRFRVRRAVKIDGKGGAKGSLSLARLDPVTGEWDEKSLNDGGERDRQALLNQILGGSEMVQRIANFSIQRDRQAFIDVHPKIRKTVIGEISGQEPLKKAHAVLDDRRRAANRALEDARQRMSGVLAIAEGAEARLEAAVAAVVTADGEVVAARAAEQAAAAAVPVAEREAQTAAGRVTATEAALAAIPATEPAVASAKTALAGYESSYATKQAERRTEYNKADTDAKDAEVQVAALAIPDPAEVERLASVARAAEETVVSARLARDGAVSASAQANAHADSAASVLRAEQAKASAIPAPPLLVGLEPLEAAVATTAEAGHLAAAKATAARESLAAARESAAGIRATLDALRRDRQALEGQDIGKCARCRQPVDSAHTEAEIKRLDTEIAAGQQALDGLQVPALEAADKDAASDLDAATAAHEQAKSNLDAARKAHADAERIEAERLAARSAVEAAQKAADESAAEAQRAAEEARASVSALDAAQQAFVAAQNAHRAAADAAATAAALQERLRSAGARMLELVEAGKADKAAHDAEVARLTAAVTSAEAAHTEAEAKRADARAALTAARADADAKTQALTNARLALSDAQGRVRLADAVLATTKQSEADLRGQIAQVEGVRVEVKMFIEQAQITSIAVEMVEQYRLGLIDNAIPFLEDRANFWLEKLGYGDMAVRFSTRDGDKDTLDVLVEDGKPGRALDIACYSGGQQARIEMAVKRALDELRRQSVGVTLALRAYDEPTDGLDAKGKQAFVEMVMADGGVQIITSHDDSIISAFDNQIRLVRGENDETVME